MVQLLTWKRAKPSNTIEVGGETVEIKPLTLENSLRLLLLLAPHLARIEARWPQLKAALAATDGIRPRLLEALFVALRAELAFAPGDIVSAFALCLNRDVAWIAEHATAAEMLAAWPVLDEINHFRDLYALGKHLGIVVKYGE